MSQYIIGEEASLARYLLFGSHGLLGSHLLERLESLGHKVVRGNRKGTVPKNIDYIIDTASYGNYSDQVDLDETFIVNVDRVRNILEQAVEAKRIILTSSSSVSLPFQTPYSASKVLMEYVALYYLEKGLPVRIVRPYTIYGIGDSQKHFIPIVFDSCLNGTPISLNPSATHDYVWVEDLVTTYLNILSYIDDIKIPVIEAGTGKATTNAEVVLQIERVTNSKANIVDFNLPPKEYDNKEWKAKDISIATTSLEKGLAKIYEYYKKQRSEKTYH